ncbi:MAG: helix-turn-helix domain-containing protein [Flavobacteriales bacterium]|jgi:AraC-like DNA-binding protein
MRLFIQNMVSMRCKLLVISILNNYGLSYRSVELGEVELHDPISEQTRNKLKASLHSSGLELLSSEKTILIERVINIVVDMVHHTKDMPKVNISTFIAEKTNLDYHRLSDLFSRTKGVTIEHFIILHKVERIKELIMYDDLNLSEIADKMHYSSLAHMSKQFKQITGLTPSFFKHMAKRTRSNIEDL